jgi:hypothetical protein
MSRETHEPIAMRADVLPATLLALMEAAEAQGIDPERNVLLTDAPDHPAGPGVRYRAWARVARADGTCTRVGGRHQATAQEAAESLLVKLGAGR